MKERVNTSLSFLSDYWHERVEPLIKKGWSLVNIFRLGVDEAEKKELDKQ